MVDDAMGPLVAEFRSLGDADRRAILARLSFDERLRFEAALRPPTAHGGYSADIAALVARGGDGLTTQAQAALAAALADMPAAAAMLPQPYRPTLFDRLWRR